MNRTLKLFLALVSLCMTVFCFAQKSELRFNKDGKFKIVQFTDVHFKYKIPLLTSHWNVLIRYSTKNNLIL